MATPILAVAQPIYQPAMRIITDIENVTPNIGAQKYAQITTSFAHNYKTGFIVRLDIPPGYGMVEANYLFAPITVTSTTQFTMPLDVTGFTPFTIPIMYPFNSQYAQCVPIGNVNDNPYLGTVNVLNTNFYN